MELVVSSISTAIVNLIVFSLIPFVWWLIRHRKETGFFQWLGFREFYSKRCGRGDIIQRFPM